MTLDDSVLGLIEKAGQFGGAADAVEYITAEFGEKYATIVGLDSELAAQAQALDARVDAVRSDSQDNRIVLEAKVTGLEVAVARARADLARSISKLRDKRAAVNGKDQSVVAKVTGLKATVATSHAVVARHIAEVRTLEAVLQEKD